LKLLLITFLFITAQAFGQNNANIKFYDLDSIKTVSSHEFTSGYKIILRTGDPNSVIAASKIDAQPYLLQKHQGNKWLVYELEGNNISDIAKNGTFVGFYYGRAGNVNGSASWQISYYTLIDLKRHSALDLLCDYEFEGNGDPQQRVGETEDAFFERLEKIKTHTSVYHMDINISGQYLTLKSTCEIDSIKYTEPFSKKVWRSSMVDRLVGCVFKYVNGTFLRITTYRYGMKGLQPVKQARVQKTAKKSTPIPN